METRDRLLDVAEQLFGEQGFVETSLRDITAAAAANLASVNYHFGGKEALLEAVFRRRVEPVNDRRLELLAAYQERCAPEAVPVEEILWAFLAPPFGKMHEWGEGGRHFMRLIGRMHADPAQWASFFLREFESVRTRFQAALARALPELAPEELTRRVHYVVGAMAHTFCWGQTLGCLDSICEPTCDEVLHSMIAFGAAGLRAPQGLIEVTDPFAAAVAGGS